MTNKMTVSIVPEKHTSPDRLGVATLLQRARSGNIHVVLEDFGLYRDQEACTYIHSLEGTDIIPIDQVIGMTVWLLDTDATTLKECGIDGVTLLCLYTYVCYTLDLPGKITAVFALLNHIRTQGVIVPSTVRGIVGTVHSVANHIFGGVPGSIELHKIREHIHEIVSSRTDMSLVDYSIYHVVIRREENMAQTINQIAYTDPLTDVFVVVGANHVCNMLTSTDISALGLNVQSIRRLQAHANASFPGQRLTDLLQDNVEIVPCDHHYLHDLSAVSDTHHIEKECSILT
jgi:hypothetical protein